MVSVSFIHDVVTEAQANFPVKSAAPCEGTGYEIGSLSIVKGARNMDAAKKFVDWALTPKAQKLGAGQQAVPAAVERQHPAVAAVAQDRRHQAHQLRLRQVRRVGRAQAPARALGSRSRLGRPLTAFVHCACRPCAAGTAPTRSPPMLHRFAALAALSLAVLAPLPAAGQGQLNLYCSSPNTAWCQGMAVGFEKATGTKVAVIQKATGEMLAQVKAEARESQGRHLVGGSRGLVPAGGRGRPARDLRVAERRPAPRLGAPDHRGIEQSRRRRLRRHPVARLQHRDSRPRRSCRCRLLERPARPRLQGRGDAGQSRIPRAPPT